VPKLSKNIKELIGQTQLLDTIFGGDQPKRIFNVLKEIKY
jgi:hypothetical protein